MLEIVQHASFLMLFLWLLVNSASRQGKAWQSMMNCATVNTHVNTTDDGMESEIMGDDRNIHMNNFDAEMLKRNSEAMISDLVWIPVFEDRRQ